MKVFNICVPGEPVAKARPRVTKSGHVYTPDKTKAHESKIRAEWFNTYEEAPAKGDVEITTTFYMERPKTKKIPRVPQKRPDIDNLIKTVLDALNGVAYEDDKQISRIAARKRWSEYERGYTEIMIIADEEAE